MTELEWKELGCLVSCRSQATCKTPESIHKSSVQLAPSRVLCWVQELLHPSIASFLCDYEHGVSPLPLCWICKNKYMVWIISEMTSSSNIWELSPWWIGSPKFTTCNLPFLTTQRTIQQWIERKTQHMTSGWIQGVNQPWKMATRKPECGSDRKEMWLFIFMWYCT